MAKIGGQRRLGQSGGRRGVINGRDKNGVSVPETQLVDRAVLLSTNHGFAIGPKASKIGTNVVSLYVDFCHWNKL